jgi:hypothetical protein
MLLLLMMMIMMMMRVIQTNFEWFIKSVVNAIEFQAYIFTSSQLIDLLFFVFTVILYECETYVAQQVTFNLWYFKWLFKVSKFIISLCLF